METKMYMDNLTRVETNLLMRINQTEKELIEVCEKLADADEDINFVLTEKYLWLKKQLETLTHNYLNYNLI
ncbi:MAG: hypothetical protein RIR01_1960 [Bacteroidota bacterium]